MPGYLLHFGATVLCAHTPGQAMPVQSSLVVKVGGQAIVTQPTSYTVAGCGLSASGATPCATAQFTSAATKVTAQQQPVLLSDSQATCAPTGTPVSIPSTQTVVKGV
jgi:hypothetical protein